MINLTRNFIYTLNVYGAEVIIDQNFNSSVNIKLINVGWELFSILFNLKLETASISDMFLIEDWMIVQENIQEKDIQPIIDKYYKKYNNLKVFY
jgi:hypothetical protein